MGLSEIIAFIISRSAELGTKTLEHLFLTGISTSIAILVGIPLGILIAHNAKIRQSVLGIVQVIQTIPSLAMLVFLLPFFGIGSTPAIIALTLYALLPIVRNTFTGIINLSDDIIEAAQGLGFTRWQRLLLVELPLAIPVIVAGIRTAAVIGVGIATLSTFIGAGGLGDFINRGLAQTDNRLILLGAIPAAILALIIDYTIGLIELFLRPEKRVKLVNLWPLLLVILLLLGLGGLELRTRMQSQQANDNANSATIHIGSKNFTEQFILGELMALLLENSREFTVVRHFNLGGTMVCHQALLNNEIDVYAEYTGTALVSVLSKDVIHSATEAYQTVNSIYQDQYNLTWLAPFGFNNTYVLTVRDDFAQKNNLEAIKDIQDIDHTMKAGFTSEFMERDDGYPGMKEAYNLNFMSVRNLEPSLLYRAIAQENVDVICAFATDGRIAAYNLKPLEDNQSFFPPYYAAPVVRSQTIQSYPQLKTILNKLGGLVSDETMQQLNFEVDEKKRDPKAVATEFLRKHSLINP